MQRFILILNIMDLALNVKRRTNYSEMALLIIRVKLILHHPLLRTFINTPQRPSNNVTHNPLNF